MGQPLVILPEKDIPIDQCQCANIATCAPEEGMKERKRESPEEGMKEREREREIEREREEKRKRKREKEREKRVRSFAWKYIYVDIRESSESECFVFSVSLLSVTTLAPPIPGNVSLETCDAIKGLVQASHSCQLAVLGSCDAFVCLSFLGYQVYVQILPCRDLPAFRVMVSQSFLQVTISHLTVFCCSHSC